MLVSILESQNIHIYEYFVFWQLG